MQSHFIRLAIRVAQLHHYYLNCSHKTTPSGWHYITPLCTGPMNIDAMKEWEWARPGHLTKKFCQTANSDEISLLHPNNIQITQWWENCSKLPPVWELSILQLSNFQISIVFAGWSQESGWLQGKFLGMDPTALVVSVFCLQPST